MAATPERPGPEHVLNQEKFADALRAAISRRDLTLDRIRARLLDRGVDISLATLSYWQQGRRRPERAKSLHALRELELILELPPNTLFDVLEPRLPRGKWQPLGDRLSFAALYGEDSPIRNVLGDEYRNPNPDVAVLNTTETCYVDETRSLRRVSAIQVLRGVNPGCDHFLVAHGVDEGDIMPHDFEVRGGELSDLRADAEGGYIAAVIDLRRELAKNETAVVEYDWVMGESPIPSGNHERRLRTASHSYLLRVCFDPAVRPSRSYEYQRPKVNAPTASRRRLTLDPSGQVHSYIPKCTPGVYGVSWEWD